MSAVRWVLVMAVGGFTGFLGGLFGKGGSAIATPLLHLVGVSPFAALASPLPATIPATAVAAWAYHRAGQIDRHVLGRLVVVGVPATVAGAVMTRWVGGGPLILITDVVVALLGLRLLSMRHPARPAHHGGPGVTAVLGREVARSDAEVEAAALGRAAGHGALAGDGTGEGAGRGRVAVTAGPAARAAADPAASAAAGLGRGAGHDLAGGPADAPVAGGGWARGGDWAVTAVGLVVGLASGLLGNSGGFLLAPLGVTVLGLPLKRALGTSLAAAAVLAVPGTVVHAALGHIDWSVTFVFGLASIPLSAAGARLALRGAATRLELIYGAALVLLGGGLLLVR